MLPLKLSKIYNKIDGFYFDIDFIIPAFAGMTIVYCLSKLVENIYDVKVVPPSMMIV